MHQRPQPSSFFGEGRRNSVFLAEIARLVVSFDGLPCPPGELLQAVAVPCCHRNTELRGFRIRMSSMVNGLQGAWKKSTTFAKATKNAGRTAARSWSHIKSPATVSTGEMVHSSVAASDTDLL